MTRENQFFQGAGTSHACTSSSSRAPLSQGGLSADGLHDTFPGGLESAIHLKIVDGKITFTTDPITLITNHCLLQFKIIYTHSIILISHLLKWSESFLEWRGKTLSRTSEYCWHSTAISRRLWSHNRGFPTTYVRFLATYVSQKSSIIWALAAWCGTFWRVWLGIKHYPYLFPHLSASLFLLMGDQDVH